MVFSFDGNEISSVVRSYLLSSEVGILIVVGSDFLPAEARVFITVRSPLNPPEAKN